MISLIKMKGVNLQTKEIIYYPRWTRVSTITETQLSKRKDFPEFGKRFFKRKMTSQSSGNEFSKEK